MSGRCILKLNVSKTRSFVISSNLQVRFRFLRVQRTPLIRHCQCNFRLASFVRFIGTSSAVRKENFAHTENIDPKFPLQYIPDPPSLPPAIPDTANDVLQLTALGEPTLASLGLCSWYPSGLVQCGLQAMHVSLNTPWWTSIALGTLMLRLVMFPIVIVAQRNAANMHNHMPVVQQLQEKFSKTRLSGNPLEAARVALKLQEYMKRNKVNPLKNMLVPLAQLPIFLSVFIGIRQMANLPVESMKTGGMGWFTDLTVADPYYILPIMTMATFLVTMELGVDGVRASSMTKQMRFFMRAMPFVILPFIANFPAAMLCYWLTSNCISLVQVLFLKIRYVKKLCGIPDLVQHDPSVTQHLKKPFFATLKQNWKGSKAAMDVETLQRMESTRFREAGLGSIEKTYPSDPTKVQNIAPTVVKSKIAKRLSDDKT